MNGLLETIVGLFGPFLLPVAVFVAGVIGYLVLVYLGRTDLGT